METACSDNKRHLNYAAKLFNKLGPITIREKFIYGVVSLGAATLTLLVLALLSFLLKEPKPIQEYRKSLSRLSAACQLGLDDICNRYFPPKILKIGKTIHWGTEGLSQPYRLFGWYSAERSGTWSRGKKSGIRFRLEEPVDDRLNIHFRYSVYHPRDKAITVRVNGGAPLTLVVTGSSNQTLDLPLLKTQIGQDGILNIQFEIKNPHSPADYGVSIDRRKIAIFMKEMRDTRQRLSPS